MTDPRTLSDDQRELLDKLEKIAMLPRPLVEVDFEEASKNALDLLERRGIELRDDDNVTIETLAVYAAGLRKDGFLLAADGVKLMIMAVWRFMEWRFGYDIATSSSTCFGWRRAKMRAYQPPGEA